VKVEMGESLMYSWLRHVKECQVVQTNWKASSQWTLYNEDRLNSLKEQYDAYYGADLFKGRSLAQVLAQAEIDVMGISSRAGEQAVYAIDVAYHGGGLLYGKSKEETVMTVIRKCARAALCVYGYMNTKSGEIIFASPKINPAELHLLIPRMEELNKLTKELGLDFTIRLIANADFDEDVFKPIMVVSKGIADTSELFIRSVQLYQMFANKDASKTNL